jgi:hypothetical protein
VIAFQDEVAWKDARNYFFDLFQVKLAQFRMARRYVINVLGIAPEDIAIRHLERGVRFVLQHLDEQAIAYKRKVTDRAPSSHRQFEYSVKALCEYERSDRYSALLNELAMKRMMHDLFE